MKLVDVWGKIQRNTWKGKWISFKQSRNNRHWSFIHSFCCLSDDMSIAYLKAISPHSVILCFLFQFTVSSRFLKAIRDWYRSINAFRAITNPEITQQKIRSVTCLQNFHCISNVKESLCQLLNVHGVDVRQTEIQTYIQLRHQYPSLEPAHWYCCWQYKISIYWQNSDKTDSIKRLKNALRSINLTILFKASKKCFTIGGSLIT
jgi:hypothetical protein